MARRPEPSQVRYLAPAHREVPAAEADATLARILNAIEEYVYTGEFLPDDSYRVVFAGPCRERFLGMSVEDARIAVWADYVHPDDVDVFEAAHESAHASGHLDVEYRLIGADGLVRWVRDRGLLRQEPGRRLLDGSILDVTGMHAAREQLVAAHAFADHLARTDPLTGVANRRSLPELLAGLADAPVGVLSVDVDRFKLVNDFYGHAAGDAVLVEVADRLRAAVGPEDRIVRMGGEEFLVLLPGSADEAAVEERAEAVRRAVCGTPMREEAEPLTTTVSIGGTWASAIADPDALLAAADHFLYVAKRAGRNQVHVADLDSAEAHTGEDESDALRLAHAMATAAAVAEGMPGDHLSAVSLLAARIAHALELSAPQVLRCRVAGLVHDLGALQVPAAVLTKPGLLTAREWVLVRGHAELGEQLVAAVPELAPVARIVRHHHERYDGTGYPDRLAEDAIPLESRIVAAADTWNAMTNERPHRPRLTDAEALAELVRAAGTQLDPQVVTALRRLVG